MASRAPNKTIALPNYRIGIVIESKKHGTKVAVVDAADYLKIEGYRWHVRKSVRKLGDTFYVKGGYPTAFLLHRVITDAVEGQTVDHRDGDALNNTKDNLRTCSTTQNCQNQKPRVGGASVYKGVWRNNARGKWIAEITIQGERKKLGAFTDEVLAARAYDGAARHLFGEFAHLNFPGETHPVPMRALTPKPVLTSKFKGVSWDKDRGKWWVGIHVNYATKYIGRFSSEVEAAKAYNIAATEVYGESAKVNKIPYECIA